MGKDTEDPEELYQKAMELIGNDESNVHVEGFLDSEAFQYLLRAGDLGHSEAQLLLGMAYSYAYAHDLDNEELAKISCDWYDKAIKNGNLRAMLIKARSEDSRELFQKVLDSNPTERGTMNTGYARYAHSEADCFFRVQRPRRRRHISG